MKVVKRHHRLMVKLLLGLLVASISTWGWSFFRWESLKVAVHEYSIEIAIIRSGYSIVVDSDPMRSISLIRFYGDRVEHPILLGKYIPNFTIADDSLDDGTVLHCVQIHHLGNRYFLSVVVPYWLVITALLSLTIASWRFGIARTRLRSDESPMFEVKIKA